MAIGLGSVVASGLEPDENDGGETTTRTTTITNTNDNNNDSSSSSSSNCPLSCFNGGSCEIHNLTNEYYCNCPLVQGGGFMGVHCETPFLECQDERRGWRCLNGGMCKSDSESDSNAASCHCLDEFGGPKCEFFLGPGDTTSVFVSKPGMLPEGEDPFSIEAIVIIAMASLVLSFVCFMGGFHVGRGNRNAVVTEDDLDVGDYSENYSENYSEDYNGVMEKDVAQLVVESDIESEFVNVQVDNEEPPKLPNHTEII